MKKRFLELLIKQAGLTPEGIETYRTDSFGGNYESVIGWRGRGVDSDGKWVIKFETPEGFNDAVSEVMSQVYNTKDIKFRTDRHFKV
jgi:hypothetical protein